MAGDSIRYLSSRAIRRAPVPKVPRRRWNTVRVATINESYHPGAKSCQPSVQFPCFDLSFSSIAHLRRAIPDQIPIHTHTHHQPLKVEPFKVQRSIRWSNTSPWRLVPVDLWQNLRVFNFEGGNYIAGYWRIFTESTAEYFKNGVMKLLSACTRARYIYIYTYIWNI